MKFEIRSVCSAIRKYDWILSKYNVNHQESVDEAIITINTLDELLELQDQLNMDIIINGNHLTIDDE